MQKLDENTLALSVIETSVIGEVMTELQRAITKHPKAWGGEGGNIGYGILEDQMDRLYTACVEGTEEDVRKYAVRTAAMAIRFLCDLRPALKVALTPQVHDVALRVGIDPQRYANEDAIAQHTGKPRTITKADGTTHHIMPLDTGRYEVNVSPLLAAPYGRGPAHHDEDEVSFGQPYDAPGG